MTTVRQAGLLSGEVQMAVMNTRCLSGLAQSLLTVALEEGESLFRRGESERRGRAHRRARAGSLLASYQWGGGGRLWAWPGLQSSWSCAPLPGGVCPLSSPRWSVRVSSAFSSSHLLCTWLRCQQSTFGTNQSFCLGLGEAQGGSIWEPLPSFRSGDQPGSEPHQAGDMVTSPLPAQGQCRFGQSV